MTRVGEQSFVGCSALKSVKIEDGRHFLPYGIFAYCSNLVNVQLANNTDWIASYAFAYCPKLDHIVLPESLEIIGLHAFKSCTGLNYVQCLSENPISFDDDISPFQDIKRTCRLVVPVGSEEAYKNAPVWKDFYRIVDSETYFTGIDTLEFGTDTKKESHVFTIGGQYVGNDINRIPSGIYIRDGKKVIIK